MEKKIANIIGVFLQNNSVLSPLEMAEHLVEKGCVIREKAKLVAHSYIQGRKFEHIYHCSRCNGIPYGGVGEDSHFCMVCGAEIEEIVNGI